MNLQSDHLDPTEADLMLLAAGELDAEAAERLRERIDGDPELRKRFAEIGQEFSWLDSVVTTALSDEPPVRTQPALRAVRKQLLSRPVVEVQERRPWKLPLSGVPTWALGSAAAAAIAVTAVLYWGLRDAPLDTGPTVANNNANAITLPSEHVTALQKQVEWAFGVDEMVAVGSVDEMAFDLDDVGERDVFDDLWQEVYQ